MVQPVTGLVVHEEQGVHPFEQAQQPGRAAVGERVAGGELRNTGVATVWLHRPVHDPVADPPGQPGQAGQPRDGEREQRGPFTADGVRQADPDRRQQRETLGEQRERADRADQQGGAPGGVAGQHPGQQQGEHGEQQHQQVVVVDRGLGVGQLRDRQRDQRGRHRHGIGQPQPARHRPEQQRQRGREEHVPPPQGQVRAVERNPVPAGPQGGGAEQVVERRVLDQLVGPLVRVGRGATGGGVRRPVRPGRQRLLRERQRLVDPVGLGEATRRAALGDRQPARIGPRPGGAPLDGGDQVDVLPLVRGAEVGEQRGVPEHDGEVRDEDQPHDSGH
ncbi:hypothetical protein [Asanoa sp. WMMD1127]|uniref:hypothetical protein n=1 Tax=Asanoa sp. WMMD1127 TaxID=3016107 RepID=UPI003241CEE6